MNSKITLMLALMLSLVVSCTGAYAQSCEFAGGDLLDEGVQYCNDNVDFVCVSGDWSQTDCSSLGDNCYSGIGCMTSCEADSNMIDHNANYCIKNNLMICNDGTWELDEMCGNGCYEGAPFCISGDAGLPFDISELTGYMDLQNIVEGWSGDSYVLGDVLTYACNNAIGLDESYWSEDSSYKYQHFPMTKQSTLVNGDYLFSSCNYFIRTYRYDKITGIKDNMWSSGRTSNYWMVKATINPPNNVIEHLQYPTPSKLYPPGDVTFPLPAVAPKPPNPHPIIHASWVGDLWGGFIDWVQGLFSW